jgi:general secretion pathway protein K
MSARRTVHGHVGARPRRGEQGIALMIVLWIILVLSLLVSGFAWTMHVETLVTSYSRKNLKAQALARAGVEVASVLLLADHRSPTEAGFDARNQAWAVNDLFYVDHPLGDGVVNVRVTDEESKLPINRASPEQLKRLVILMGVDPFDADVIVDSILDWIDENDLVRLNGAEDDYYLSLSPPYRAKNGPIDRVEELLLVRGVTPEIFYGTPATETEEAQPGLRDLVTALSTGRVNVNTAAPIVLQAWFDLDESQAQLIEDFRSGADGLPGTEDDQGFQRPDEFFGLIGGLDTETRSRLQRLLTVSSSFFTVESTGEAFGVKRTVIAVLRRDRNATPVVDWRELRGGL